MRFRSIASAIGFLCVSISLGSLLGCGTGSGEAKLVSIAITPANQSIAKGTTLQLAATGTYADKKTKVLDEVTWESGQPGIAAIDTTGVATAASEGVARISATFEGVTGATSISIGKPALQSISVTPNPSSLPIGESEQLTATGTYSDGSVQDVTHTVVWTSSASTVTVALQGVATGAAMGAATISAAQFEIKGTATVTVGQPALLSIAVAPNQSSLPLGESAQLSATGTFSDGTTQDLTQSATWTSSSPTVASLNGPGAVAAAGIGSAQLSAAYQGVTGNASVTVSQPALLSIAVSPNPSSLPLGESEQLQAVGNFSDGSVQNLTQSATWTSTAPTIASVTATGSVTGKVVGAAQLSAAYQGITGVASVTVAQPALLSIAVSPNPSSLPLGETQPLQATGTYSDGSTQNLTQTATWSSSPPTIASVNTQGVVSGLAIGAAQLSAVYQGVTGSATVNVGKPVLLSITISPNQASLPVDESKQLQANGNFSDGSIQNLTQSVTWASSAPTIATVNATGTVAAVKIGTATISATSASITGSASVNVTPAAIVALNIVPATVSMVLESGRQLQAIGTLSDGTTQNMTSSVTWSSIQPAIASVTSGGFVTANSIGSTTIMAVGGGFTASAGVTVNPMLLVTYFNLANSVQSGIDGTLQIVHPGVTLGDMCAMVYVFDSKQELNECCGCKISESGMRSLSLINDLTSNTLTGKKPVAGTIEVVPSDVGQNGLCNAGTISPESALAAWDTNVQASQGTYTVTETTLSQTSLSSAEAAVLATECSMMQQLGSGQGICSCGTGDQGSAKQNKIILPRK